MRAKPKQSAVMVKEVVRALNVAYGEKHFDRGTPLVDLLIQTVLSQNTNAANCRLAYHTLRLRFPDWEKLSEATPDDIADAIHVGGLSSMKSRVIKTIAHKLLSERGRVYLEWLSDLTESEAFDYLMAFDGVGPKTAACVLMFGLGHPVLPVDTHVHRIAERLGLIEIMPVKRAHELLNKLVAPDDIHSFHVNAITHGRRVCRAIKPCCAECVLADLCDYTASHPLPAHMP